MPVLKTAARKGYEVMVWGMAISPCVVFHPADRQVPCSCRPVLLYSGLS